MKRILLVDDDADLRELYARYLDDAGFCVAVARDGAEAVEVASMVHPHAIVMDLAMPHMDGAEAARRIKADASIPHTPLVGLTGEPDAAERAADFDRMLQKPLPAPQLANLLKSVVH